MAEHPPSGVVQFQGGHRVAVGVAVVALNHALAPAKRSGSELCPEGAFVCSGQPEHEVSLLCGAGGLARPRVWSYQAGILSAAVLGCD